MISASAAVSSSTYFSGSTIMRCTSSGRCVAARTALTTIGPMVRLGTKRPSITSTWIRSAPASSTARTSSASLPKSADRIEGAILIAIDLRLAGLGGPRAMAELTFDDGVCPIDHGGEEADEELRIFRRHVFETGRDTAKNRCPSHLEPRELLASGRGERHAFGRHAHQREPLQAERGRAKLRGRHSEARGELRDRILRSHRLQLEEEVFQIDRPSRHHAVRANFWRAAERSADRIERGATERENVRELGGARRLAGSVFHLLSRRIQHVLTLSGRSLPSNGTARRHRLLTDMLATYICH